jgi:hypothetical protein
MVVVARASPVCVDAGLDSETLAFYRRTVRTLTRAGVPFLVGGAYAFAQYTGIIRHTKDFDVFVRPEHARRALTALEADGCRTEVTFAHWLGKARCGEEFVDVIFGAGNGVACVDDGWFEHAVHGKVFGLRVQLCPVEETIWSKSFIQERERYDGADVAHLLHARGLELDWPRLLERFGEHWRVLLSHMVLFGFIYPAEREKLPAWVMQELTRRLAEETRDNATDEAACQGTLLSRAQYLHDIEHCGYQDPRLRPRGGMTRAQVARWTAAIADDGDPGGPHGDVAAGGGR